MLARRMGVVTTGLILTCVRASLLAADEAAIRSGELRICQPDGQFAGVCPLKHTSVESDIAGYVGRTRVRQTFTNPLDRKIEAVYVFPLPQDAAVDEMVMLVGERRVVGQIKERDEARAVYERAKASGHVASLLDQERPNIFTQSVANIEPGVTVEIELSYVETLKYEDGVFEFVFPMVVGPRYMPGTPTGQEGTGWAPDTTQVPDASKISPPVAVPGTRAGHDISLTVRIDAGLPIQDLGSELHEIAVERPDERQVIVSLKNEVEIPNKDFILRYRTATDQIADTFLTHTDARGTFLTVILQPPRRIEQQQIVPRELVFVLDTSGSMSGFPIDKAKEVMAKAIDAMRPTDSFNLITFSGSTSILWDTPRPATEANRAEAQKFLAERKGRGGTEMMKAIEAALVQTKPQGLATPAIRVVVFMTDGYVGNDMAIIDAVQKNAGTTRVFSFGIGNSVNRFLLNGMAQAGRGEVEYVTLAGQADVAVTRLAQRINAPILTDVTIDWGAMSVSESFPRLIPDLFAAKPIMVHARLAGPAEGTIKLRGHTPAGPFERTIEVKPAAGTHDALASLWARAKVADLMSKDFAGLQQGTFPPDLRETITGLGLQYRLMTQFTSFVAVEELTVTVAGEPVKIAVPVEMPEGVDYEGVFGERGRRGQAQSAQLMMQQEGSVAAKRTTARSLNRPFLQPGRADSTVLAGAAAAPVLPESLTGLAEKVSNEGKDGNLTSGSLRVVAFRLDVMIYLSDTSPETLEAIRNLGFVQTGESKAVRLIIGTIDVRKLEELAKLQNVVRIEPVSK